ncbi:hypothetical protein Tco_0318244, partial [Tanacetum coccineum]
IPIEDQPLPANALPTALSPGYVANSDPLKEDLEEDTADYPTNGGDDEEEEESSEDDDDEEEDDASEEDKDEEDEHLALADSVAATPPPPRSPRTKVPFSQTRLCRVQKTVRLQPPMAASTEVLIAEIPSSPLLLPPLHTSPTYARASLSYRAAIVQLRATSPSTYHLLLPSEIPSPHLPLPSPPLLLPSADRRSDIPEVDMPSRKRLCLTAPASRFEVGESSTAAAARKIGHTLACRVDYG